MASRRPPDEEESSIDDDRTALLDIPAEPDRVPARIARRLYVSHFLSACDSRVFESGAVLYLATIFPGTLLPMSVYALTRGLSANLFAPAVVRLSIVSQRLVVAVCCALFYFLTVGMPLGPGAETGMLVVLTSLACIEKLCSIMNPVAVEKDWVVIIADNNYVARMTLNAQMRRIDLVCKLFGPLFIALVAGFSTKVAILANSAMNVASRVLE